MDIFDWVLTMITKFGGLIESIVSFMSKNITVGKIEFIGIVFTEGFTLSMWTIFGGGTFAVIMTMVLIKKLVPVS